MSDGERINSIKEENINYKPEKKILYCLILKTIDINDTRLAEESALKITFFAAKPKDMSPIKNRDGDILLGQYN